MSKYKRELHIFNICLPDFQIKDKTANENIWKIHSGEIKYSDYKQTPQYPFRLDILIKSEYILELRKQKKQLTCIQVEQGEKSMWKYHHEKEA